MVSEGVAMLLDVAVQDTDGELDVVWVAVGVSVAEPVSVRLDETLSVCDAVENGDVVCEMDTVCVSEDVASMLGD